MAATQLVLAFLVMKMEEVTQRVGINISHKKSEVMVVTREQEQLSVEILELRGKRLKQTEEYMYLGSATTSDGWDIRDMKRRLAGAARAIDDEAETVGRERGVPESENEDFQCSGGANVNLCASTWVMTRTEEKKLDALEMKMLHAIMVMT